ncbi:hypothetical protein QFZ27_004671 [Inquilinus ginsengisoli]|uniref:STM4504/CBY_0614 family protein n=1 Tax=Inquilinus ginsengisoli TaxID=363840 RepID=UPI003D1F5E61
MPIYDVYSKRAKRAAGDFGDVFQYETMPQALRVQIQMIFKDALGPTVDSYNGVPGKSWSTIRTIVCREHGIHTLNQKTDPADDILSCLESKKEIMLVLDVLETGFWAIEAFFAKFDATDRQRNDIKQSARDAISEANQRMREVAFGFQYESGKLIRVDSQFIHAEIVKPALKLLSDKRFEGAEKEYLNAHGHYRHLEFKDAIVDANNAFESTLKTICELRNWEFKRGARASDLLKVVRKNGLMPDYLDNSFDQLYATLVNGLPEVRNNEGGHGDGSTPKQVPQHVAAYALHLAATNIVFMVEAFRALPPSS